ncbi:MAG: alcohol dehydrogenase catalytic domain-containing protein [Planctomycetota bacterium]
MQFDGTNLSFRQDVTRPRPNGDEALIRVHVAGICSTDLEIVRGYFGFQGTLGHEFVGTVEEVHAKGVADDQARSAMQKWVGKRVVSSINFADVLSPEYAQFGLEHHPHREVLGIFGRDGAMADYVTVPVQNLFAVDPELEDRAAVFTEPLAAGIRIAEQIKLAPSLRACVLGPGRLGMLVARVLQLSGVCVAVIGRSIKSLELPKSWGMPTGMSDSFPTSSFDLVVDTTGNPRGMQEAIRLTKPLGTIVLKSTYEGLADVDLTKVVVDEIQVRGSRCGPFAPALRMLKSKRIQTNELIDGEYDIERGLEAFELASQPGIRKVLLHFKR